MIYLTYIGNPKWGQRVLNSNKVFSMFVTPATIKYYQHILMTWNKKVKEQSWYNLRCSSDILQTGYPVSVLNDVYCLTAFVQTSFITRYPSLTLQHDSNFGLLYILDIFRELLADIKLCISSLNFRISDSARSSTRLFSKYTISLLL